MGKTPYRFIGVKEIADAFKEYKVGRANAEALAVPFQPASGDDTALVNTKYALNSELQALCPDSLPCRDSVSNSDALSVLHHKVKRKTFWAACLCIHMMLCEIAKNPSIVIQLDLCDLV